MDVDVGTERISQLLPANENLQQLRFSDCYDIPGFTESKRKNRGNLID